MAKKTRIWTDGSALGNPRGAMGWAWVDNQGAHDSGGAKVGTNQIGELTGVLMALKAHPSGPITIVTDSEYVLNVFEKWSKGWKKNGWVLRDGSPVKNLPLVKSIRNMIDSRKDDVEFKWVKGHSTNSGNNRADELAHGYSMKIDKGEAEENIPPECAIALKESKVVQTGHYEKKKMRGLYHKPGDSKHGHWKMLDDDRRRHGRK